MPLAAAVCIIGCDDPRVFTNLQPEGPPKVLQVLVKERVINANGSASVSTQLAFGDHPDISTTLDDRTVTNALATGTDLGIRIVFDELLLGGTVEEMACADGSWSSIPAGTTPDDVANCATTVDPLLTNCTAVCLDPSGSPIGILDDDGFVQGEPDGAADSLRLIPGVARILCDGTEIPLNAANSFYQPSGNQLIPGGPIGLNGLGPALILEPDTGFRTGATCTVELATTVTDKDGERPCAPTSVVVTGQRLSVGECASAGDLSPIQFQIEGLRLVGNPSPQDGQMNVANNKTILAAFNTALDPASVVAAVTILEGTTDVTANFTIGLQAADDKIIEMLPPVAGLTKGATYTVNVSTALADTFGGTLDPAISFSFTVESPVQFVSSVPTDNATDVVATDAITVTFDGNLDPATVAGAVTVLEGATDVTGDFTIGLDPSDAKVIVLTPPVAGMTRGAVYSVTVTTGLLDTDGAPIGQAVNFSFTVVPLLEFTSSVPTDGATGVVATDPVRLTFNVDIDPASLAGVVTILEGAADVTGTFTIGLDPSDAKVIVLTPPVAGMTPAAVYTIMVTTGLTDTFGGLLQLAVNFTFTIA